MKAKKTARILLLILVIGGTLPALQRLLVPKYMDQVIEGAFISEYYEETTPHDLLILGDCEVYENISPVTLWREYGITSYIRGSAQQLMAQSYYLLEDALRYEKPAAVLLSISAMQEEKQVKEAYNRMTMEGMRWSRSKFDAIMATKLEDEHMLDYVVPLLRYHSRFKELKADDITYFWRRDKVSHNGYYMRADVQPLADFPTERRRADYQFSDSSYEYLDRIRVLCEENDIVLVLMKAPSLYPAWYDQWEQQITDYAAEHELTYINCIPKIEEIGLDFNEDTYNGGQHLNVYGAEKLSRYLGALLSKEPGLKDNRQDGSLQTVWQEKMDFYEKMKESQEVEFRETGRLQKFHVE